MDFSKLLVHLNELSTTHICDAYENARVLGAEIRPISAREKIWGKAFTVSCEGDLLPVIQAINSAETGSIIVINSGNSDRAMLGEIFSTAAQMRNISGMIIDGYCRDAASIRQLSFPVYARGISPKAGTTQRTGKLQTSIECGGVTIFPGDVIFCDDNGIVALNETELEKILPDIIKIIEKENIAIERIKSGAALTDIFNFNQQ